MPRELTEALAPAMVPTAHVAAVPYDRSLLRLVMRHKIEAEVIGLSVLWLILRLLQSILGPRRRLTRHWFVQYGAWAAYYLPSLIAFYTANAVYSSSSDNKIVLIWGSAVLLFSCARGAVTMTAFTNLGGDGRPRRLQSWRLLKWLIYFAWLQWGLLWGDHKLTVKDVCYLTVICLGPILYILLAKPRAALLDYETKEFADYMVRESRLSPPFFLHEDNPNSQLHDGCKYPFMLSDGQWIHFSDLLKVLGRLPGDVAVDPDNCLSYSFCRLLARRYFGFPCVEDGNVQVREFVLTELLADCNRAFTIVEVQLALLHDYFFTNYHTHITSGFVSVKKWILYLLRQLLLYIVSITIGFLINGAYKGDRSALVISVSSSVAMFIIIGMIQQPKHPVLPRYWHPIRNLFLFYDENEEEDATSSPPVIYRSSAPLSRQSSRVAYWREKMDQYSILEDYDRRCSKKAITAWCKVHLLSQASYSFIKHHPAEEKDVSIPNRLKWLVARTIRELNGPPTIGAMSLVMQGDNRAQLDDLSWTCRQDTLTHTILIWHLATCYCDMSLEEEPSNEGYHNVATTVSRYCDYLKTFLPKLLCGMSQPLEEETPQSLEEDLSTGEYRNIAMTLSRYCAYLVAFLPDLLPEHSLTAKVVLQQVLQESRDLLGRTRMSMDAKRARIRQLQLLEDESSLTTFHKGVRLGRQLEQQQEVLLRWKTMADFWAEMILYIASSSGNATTHIEQLAQGGEFVTHLWALLCNAGITGPELGKGGTDSTAA